MGKTKVVFWGRNYFHWKNVSTLYFLFSSPGRSSDVDVTEGPSCSNPSRMTAKVFPYFTVLHPTKIILLCVMLQTHHQTLILGTSLTSSGNVILGESLGLDEMNLSKLQRIVQDLSKGGTMACYLPCNTVSLCTKKENWDRPLQAM